MVCISRGGLVFFPDSMVYNRPAPLDYDCFVRDCSDTSTSNDPGCAKAPCDYMEPWVCSPHVSASPCFFYRRHSKQVVKGRKYWGLVGRLNG